MMTLVAGVLSATRAAKTTVSRPFGGSTARSRRSVRPAQVASCPWIAAGSSPSGRRSSSRTWRTDAALVFVSVTVKTTCTPGQMLSRLAVMARDSALAATGGAGGTGGAASVGAPAGAAVASAGGGASVGGGAAVAPGRGVAGAAVGGASVGGAAAPVGVLVGTVWPRRCCNGSAQAPGVAIKMAISARPTTR
ncbi:MAG: hypothetical protein BWY52_02810 [Chloroflexi bacterium ADurb.Bin325]|nr:MAG: hypothetical protein BWY52_02810 [Chloroflexi bacterium ADurb.Bin325]